MNSSRKLKEKSILFFSFTTFTFTTALYTFFYSVLKRPCREIEMYFNPKTTIRKNDFGFSGEEVNTKIRIVDLSLINKVNV